MHNQKIHYVKYHDEKPKKTFFTSIVIFLVADLGTNDHDLCKKIKIISL